MVKSTLESKKYLDATGGISPLITIITPVLNEEGGIRGFLDHLAGLQGSFELIIVDGGSADATCALIRDHAGKIPLNVNLISAPKGRSTQMNMGAATARGEILLFLHADCRIPADSLRVISEACSKPGVCGGAFTPDCGDAGLFSTVGCRVASTLAALSGIFFGDFGIFVQRDVFVAAGGFAAIPYCEDIEFCRSARRFGRMMQIDRIIHSSPRRFERVGRTKLTAVYILATVLNLAGIRPLFLKRYIVDQGGDLRWRGEFALESPETDPVRVRGGDGSDLVVRMVNGRPDFADVVLSFDQMSRIAGNEPIEAFDCNGNGRIDFADVVWLFNSL